jgi:hypothetical protein
MSPSLTIVSWVVRLVAAGILLQTLYFKFTAAPESVYIFTKIGAEPWGRIGSGIVELITAILLLIPAYAWLGGLLGVGIGLGAVIYHLTVLGIEVQDDRGLLFGLALTVLACSLFVLFLYRICIPLVGRSFA